MKTKLLKYFLIPIVGIVLSLIFIFCGKIEKERGYTRTSSMSEFQEELKIIDFKINNSPGDIEEIDLYNGRIKVLYIGQKNDLDAVIPTIVFNNKEAVLAPDLKTPLNFNNLQDYTISLFNGEVSKTYRIITQLIYSEVAIDSFTANGYSGIVSFYSQNGKISASVLIECKNQICMTSLENARILLKYKGTQVAVNVSPTLIVGYDLVNSPKTFIVQSANQQIPYTVYVCLNCLN